MALLSLQTSQRVERFLFGTSGAEHHNLFKLVQQVSEFFKSVGFFSTNFESLSGVMGGFRGALGLSYLHNRVNFLCESMDKWMRGRHLPGTTTSFQFFGKLAKTFCEVIQAFAINYGTLFCPFVLGRSDGGAGVKLSSRVSFVGDTIETCLEGFKHEPNVRRVIAPAISAITGGIGIFAKSYASLPVVRAAAAVATFVKLWNAWEVRA